MPKHLHTFLTLALYWGEWSASSSSHLNTRGRAPCTLWVGGCIGPSTGLNVMATIKLLILLGIKLWSSAHSKSLHWVIYPSLYCTS